LTAKGALAPLWPDMVVTLAVHQLGGDRLFRKPAQLSDVVSYLEK
jgi:hypothetical protein